MSTPNNPLGTAFKAVSALKPHLLAVEAILDQLDADLRKQAAPRPNPLAPRPMSDDMRAAQAFLRDMRAAYRVMAVHATGHLLDADDRHREAAYDEAGVPDDHRLVNVRETLRALRTAAEHEDPEGY